MKLDVEGYEYALLEHLLRDRVVCKLDLLAVEWHELSLLVNASRGLSVQLTQRMESGGCGLPVLAWT